jgi:dUTP pyrophosphatase
MIPLKVKRLNENARLPTRAHSVDAGLDLYSIEDLFIEHGTTVKVKTGLVIDVPVGYVAKVEDRSGLASKGLRTGAGVIDPQFFGEINVVIHNLTNVDDMDGVATLWDKAKFGYRIKAGQRIAQLLFYKVESPDIVEVSELGSSHRGESGWGASGL